MKRITMRKIISLALAFLTTLSVGFAVLFGSGKLTTASGEAAQASEDKIKIVVGAAHKDANGVATPDSGNVVSIQFGVLSPLLVEVRIYYSTHDVSAIAAKGDYEATEGCVVFPVNNTIQYKTIGIKVAANGAATVVDGVATARQFRFTIDRIECAGSYELLGGNLAPLRSRELVCSAGYSISYTVKKSGGFNGSNYFEGYADSEVIYGPHWYTPEIRDGKTYIGGLVRVYDQEKSVYAKKLIDNGLASLYVNLFAILYEDAIFGSGDNIDISLCYADSGGVGRKLVTLDLELSGRSSQTYWDIFELTASIDKSVPENALLAAFFASNNQYHYYKLPDSVKDPWLWIEIWDKEDCSARYFNPAVVNAVAVDTTAPTITEYYFQENVKKGEKWGLSVRFSEPVQICGDAPSMKADVNGFSAKQLTFDYVGGSGTDTLYFEAEIPESYEMLISRMRMTDIVNRESICDFSYRKYEPNVVAGELDGLLDGHNVLAEPATHDVVDCNLDLRTPQISASGSVPTSALRYTDVSLKIENAALTGCTLFYAWTSSEEAPSDYYNSLPVTAKTQIVRGQNLNGRKWLHVKIVSAYGKEAVLSRGAYLFDSSPPELSVELNDTSGLKRKDFTIEVNDGWMECAGIDKIYMRVSTSSDGTNPKEKVVYTGSGESSATVSYSVSAADVGLSGDEYGVFYLAFYAVDKAGNSVDTSALRYVAYRFDLRETFGSEFNGAEKSDGGNALLEKTADGALVIDVSAAETDVRFTAEGGLAPYVERFVGADGTTFTAYGQTTTGSEIKLTFTDAPAGYYELVLYANDGGTKKVSDVYSLYLTKNGEDDTAHYMTVKRGTLLINRVFRLSENPYYYKDASGVVQTSYYGNSSLPASFSSEFEARSYAYYMELQDLYAVKLDETAAIALNEGITVNFAKAKGETVTAQAGQVWIRYKSATWQPGSSSNAWVYYYYQGANVSIDTGRLSNNLKESLSLVSERICGYGKEVYLAGENNLNALGEPYLAPAQIHSVYESASQTMCGNPFVVDVFYQGDADIYASYATEGGTEYPIVSNLPISFGDHTKLYYKQNSASAYTEIVRGAGKYLSDYIKATGVYQIKELDDGGMRVFSVYVDANAPGLNVTWEDSNGVFRTADLDESAAGYSYSAKSFTLGAISALEKDEYAYVAVYRYTTSTTGTLLNVYTRSDLEQGGIALDGGNYHVEVADRSGNRYSFVLRINASDLVCAITETENSFIRVTCNRQEEQIASYEVTLNGKLLDSVYAPSKTYKESGQYLIYIRDIYNNVYEQSYTFTRTIPIVNWKYNVNGSFVAYDEETTQMNIKQTDEKTFVITTSAALQFSFAGDYSYSFASAIDYTESPITHAVTIRSLTAFRLKVWYTAYPEIYVTYICAIDTTPPAIVARREVVYYDIDERDELIAGAASGAVGEEIAYGSIGYHKQSTTEKFVNEGETVTSRLIRLSVTDVGGVASVKVYLDGSLFLDLTENFTGIVLSRYGSYTVEAKDIFGNASRFTFENRKIEAVGYSVDGEAQDVDYSCLQYFLGGEYKKKEYGNGEVALISYRDADLAYRISADGSVPVVVAFRIREGALYRLSYEVVLAEDGRKTVGEKLSEALLSAGDSEKKVGEWYCVFDGVSGLRLLASFDAEGRFSLKAEIDGESVYTVEARVISDSDSEPFYFRCELSKMLSDVGLTDADGEAIETNREWKQIKINRAFVVSESCAQDANLVSVKVYYSPTGEFRDGVVVYDGRYHAAEFSAEGMYLVEIENVYGNVTSYFLTISEKFLVTTTAEFADGEYLTYSTEYAEPVYCNAKVFITAYANVIGCTVLRDGVAYDGYESFALDDCRIYLISEAGKYVVTLTDEYGNVFRREIEINARELAEDDALLYGYNEDALKRDEGYTNLKLSVSAEQVRADGIVYLAVAREGGETVVLYDLISETKTALNERALTECVGAAGDGVYTVLFRDKYGNLLTETVHYRSTPTLELFRTLRSSSEKQVCSLDGATEEGLWSNNSLHFFTTAEQYVFAIDGNRTECPYTLAFGSGAEEGSFAYLVSYLDEYGFRYEFTAHLLRKKIEIVLPASVAYTELGGIPTTRSGFSVLYNENAVCRYTLNGGEEREYTRDAVLYADGTYRFVVSDAAGNVTSYTVRKDSAVQFEFKETSTETTLVNGGIACTGKVSFLPKNGDDAYLKKVFLDGTYLSDFKDNKFTESGKWELILADGAGNEAYFTFYILTHSVKEFVYTTPYLYRISEVWFDAGDGIRLSYMEFVTGDGTVCEFTENGSYSVVMSSEVTGETANFSVTVNNVAPVVSLVGCNENETTVNDVTVTGYKVGDTIEVYRNGEKVSTVKVLSMSADVPKITEGGDYTIVVRNEAGVETQLSFTRKHIPNTAGNVLIFLSIFASVALITVGLVYRNHSKSDD